MRTKREVREKMEQLGFRVGQLVGNVHPFARVRSFDPGTLQIMGVALDSAWYKLLVSGSALTAAWRAEHTREALASQIVASAQLGARRYP
jgi:hypothetical protein